MEATAVSKKDTDAALRSFGITPGKQERKASTPAKGKGEEGIPRFHRFMGRLLEGGKRYAKKPGSFLDMPAYWGLSGLCFKVLDVLWYYYFKRDGITSPGVNTIMKAIYGTEYTRMDRTAESHRRAIARAIDGLKIEGFVYQLRRGSRGYAAEYYLARNERQRRAIRLLNAWSRRSRNKEVNA